MSVIRVSVQRFFWYTLAHLAIFTHHELQWLAVIHAGEMWYLAKEDTPDLLQSAHEDMSPKLQPRARQNQHYLTQALGLRLQGAIKDAPPLSGLRNALVYT